MHLGPVDRYNHVWFYAGKVDHASYVCIELILGLLLVKGLILVFLILEKLITELEKVFVVDLEGDN